MKLDNEIYAKFSQINRLFQKNFIKNFKKNSPFVDPSRGQGRILKALQIKDGISTKDLAYILGIQVCSLNELLHKLENNGYIYREPSEKDKRVTLIYLTDKGKEANFEFPGSEEMLDGFTEEEKEVLNKFLNRIIENMQLEDENYSFEKATKDFEKAAKEFKEAAREFGPFSNGFNPMGKGFGNFFFKSFQDFWDCSDVFSD